MIGKVSKLFILAVTLLLTITFLILIPRANITVSENYTPSSVPFVYKVNEHQLENEPFTIPYSQNEARIGIEYEITDPLYFKDFNTVNSEIDLPMFYWDFDNQYSVVYAFLNIKATNNTDATQQTNLGAFTLYSGIVPASYSDPLMSLYNSYDSSELNAGESKEFTVVYRFLKNGFSEEAWNSLQDSTFTLVFFENSTDKYCINVPAA